MKNKKNNPKKSIGKELVEDTVYKILQLLSIELPIEKLIILRDSILRARVRHWDKKSFLGKALMFHYQHANLSKLENISYHHLLMAELIRNFSIASKEEYLDKCKEFRIYPFQDKVISKKTLQQSNMTLDNLLDIMKKSFDDMNKKHKKDQDREIENALNQPYPICSFDELMGKSRLN
jgi:hypothetical protein